MKLILFGFDAVIGFFSFNLVHFIAIVYQTKQLYCNRNFQMETSVYCSNEIFHGTNFSNTTISVKDFLSKCDQIRSRLQLVTFTEEIVRKFFLPKFFNPYVASKSCKRFIEYYKTALLFFSLQNLMTFPTV